MYAYSVFIIIMHVYSLFYCDDACSLFCNVDICNITCMPNRNDPCLVLVILFLQMSSLLVIRLDRAASESIAHRLRGWFDDLPAIDYIIVE